MVFIVNIFAHRTDLAKTLEDWFMKNKQLFIILIALSLIISNGGCNKLSVNHKEHNNQMELTNVNWQGIKTEIERSYMPDSGFRFANLEYSEQLSAYATYYVREAKKNIDLISNDDKLSDEVETDLVKKFMLASKLDITDIYCTLLLINNRKNITDEAKQNVSNYLNSLYDENYGCYSLFNDTSGDIFILNVYPTFLAYSIATSLEIETKPIDAWLKGALKELTFGKILEGNSSAYLMLFQLSKQNNIHIQEKSRELIISMFENSFINLDTLVNSSNIYLPVYLMDYLEFCLLTGPDSKINHEKIITILSDENGIKSGVLVEHDAYGLYAAIRSLKLSNYDFNSCSNFASVFDRFDSFLLTDSAYIAPGYAESNFIDTYYVDAIIHATNLYYDYNIAEYCKSNMSLLIENGVINTYYYIDLLQRNNLIDIISEVKRKIINSFQVELNSLVFKEELSSNELSTLKATIKGLNLLGQKWSISGEQLDKIKTNFIDSVNKQQLTYDLVEMIDFILLVNPNKKDDLTKYCTQLENELINIANTDVSNKLMLLSRAVCAFDKCKYFPNDKLITVISELLISVQDPSGLYKGGDADEDVVSFRNTYDAIMLHQYLNKNKEE